MATGNRKEVLQRVYLVWAAYLLIALAIVGKIFYIAFVKGDYYVDLGKKRSITEVTIEAERGNIYSDDKSLLATSLPYFDIRFDPLASLQYYEEMKEKLEGKDPSRYNIFPKNIDSLSICISKYLKPGLSPGEIKRWLIAKQKQKQRYLLISEGVSYETMMKVKQFPLFRLGPKKSGLIITQRSKRIMPYGDMALRTIGYVRANAPSVGLEAFYNNDLKGESGKRLMQFIKPKALIPINDLTEISPRNGQDIVTTLDVEIQDVATSSLRTALENHDAANGCVIVMDVKTGAIKAIANLTKTENGYAETYNYAIANSIEPGSTFKLASVMAMLEDHKANLTDSINVNYGKDIVCGREMKDAEPNHNKYVTLQRAFEISSNVGISKAVVKAYGQDRNGAFQFVDRLKQFHLGQRTGVDLEGEPKPLIKTPYNQKQLWSRTTLAWMAHGYETQFTPLQLLTFYNAVANNGKMMKPYLVSEIQSQGETDQVFPPVVLNPQICSQETIDKAHQLLEGVALRGTARGGRSDYYTFAGKTGTASMDYGVDRGRYRASFAGYFPAKDPVYSCIVVITTPRKNGYHGAQAALPVFCSIAQKCMSIDPQFYKKITPASDMTASSEYLPNKEIGARADYVSIFTRLGIETESKGSSASQWVKTNLEGTTINLIAYDQQKVLVPDVRGMGLRDALYALESRGLSAVVDGYGHVAAQNISPGTKVSGQRIELKLE